MKIQINILPKYFYFNYIISCYHFYYCSRCGSQARINGLVGTALFVEQKKFKALFKAFTRILCFVVPIFPSRPKALMVIPAQNTGYS